MPTWLNSKQLTLACVLYCTCLLFAGLWPFNFRAENHAYMIAGGGLNFDAPAGHSKRNLGGMAFTPKPLACLPRGGCDEGTLTLQIVLIAESESRHCLRRVVELRRLDGTKAFYLAQWKSSLIVRTFSAPLSGGKPYREIGVGGVLAAGRTSLVTIVAGTAPS